MSPHHPDIEARPRCVSNARAYPLRVLGDGHCRWRTHTIRKFQLESVFQSVARHKNLGDVRFREGLLEGWQWHGTSLG